MRNLTAMKMKQIEQVLTRLRPRIISIGGGNDAGDDLFGDVSLACVQKVDRYSWDDPRIDGRVIKIALNLNASRFKRRERHQTVGKWLVEDGSRIRGNDPCRASLDRSEICERMKRLVEQLPAKDRQIIWSHIVNNEPHKLIANRLHMTAINVRSRLCRALKTLRLELNRQ